MDINTRWITDKIELTIDNLTIELLVEDAEEMFNELSRVLYGRVLKDE